MPVQRGTDAPHGVRDGVAARCLVCKRAIGEELAEDRALVFAHFGNVVGVNCLGLDEIDQPLAFDVT